MAITATVAPQVFGPCMVSVDGEDLGFSRDQIPISYEHRTVPVPSDRRGGTEGVPVDIQHMGQMARVRMELTELSPSTVAKVYARYKGATVGSSQHYGYLLRDSRSFILRMYNTANGVYVQFPCALPSNMLEVSVGSKYSTLSITWECIPSSTDVLYTTN